MERGVGVGTLPKLLRGRDPNLCRLSRFPREADVGDGFNEIPGQALTPQLGADPLDVRYNPVGEVLGIQTGV